MHEAMLGLAAGTLLGTLLGLSAADKRARGEVKARLRQVAAACRVEITDPAGTALSVEEFICRVTEGGAEENRKNELKLALEIALGAVLLAIALFFNRK